ncbi:hypothetical protein E2C01_053156 [Portunus trituberculatus]|uniref:Uncharacterized protein n=1 Tax=Portunus trituberculatus TaxID=210409 RepID=A0A5B7GGC3_PORTR|nr:hypothetical protein [Portunus trituberculatus]
MAAEAIMSSRFCSKTDLLGEVGFRHMRTHMLAANGFCVVSIDSRGSDNRGVSFQAHLMNRMVSVSMLLFDFIGQASPKLVIRFHTVVMQFCLKINA